MIEWKNFNEEMPEVLKEFILKNKNSDSLDIQRSSIKRPYDVFPEKYNQNYYEIILDNKWVHLCDDVKENFEWVYG